MKWIEKKNKNSERWKEERCEENNKDRIRDATRKEHKNTHQIELIKRIRRLKETARENENWKKMIIEKITMKDGEKNK